MPIKPPPFEASFIVGKRLRFTCTTAQLTEISRATLLDLMVQAATAVSAYRIFSAAKLRRVSIWSNPPGTGAVVTRTTSILWLSEQGPTRLVSDSGVGASFGARLASVPPPNSLAGFWSLTGSDETVALALLQLNVGDVVDLDLSFMIQNNFFGITQTGPVAVVVAGATAGTVYCQSLDFVGATANVPPVDYPSVPS